MSLHLRWTVHGQPLPDNYGEAVIRWLESFGGARFVGMLVSGGVLVRDGFVGGYRVWQVSDNGGELNVGPVNDDAAVRSVAYATGGGVVNPATLAYRIHQVMRGRPVDYGEVLELERPA